MAIRSRLAHLQPLSPRQMRFIKLAKESSLVRGISSNGLSASTFRDLPPSKENNDIDLKSKLLFFTYPRRSATSVLQKWVSEGRKVSIYDLRDISRQLVRRGRYKHALQVMKWMEDQNRFQFSESDHALRLESTIKGSTLHEAEDYFAKLPNTAAQKASYLHLLNSYVKEKSTEKAESLMMKMTSLGANVTPHPFNAMMKLYIATSQFDLVLSVISQMKQNNIPRNVLSYNLWMSAIHEVHGVQNVDIVYKEMLNDNNVRVGWSSLCTLANIYTKSGDFEKANTALENAENKLSFRYHLGYFFLITNYASLKNKQGVIRVWESCKRVDAKLTCANYMCMLLSLVKLGDIKEAEKIYTEWESQCWRYDIRVSNILLGGYVRGGLMEKAEGLHARTLERGGCPNYKTWEILMEGYVGSGEMEKAVVAMKNGFRMLKDCEWRPSGTIVESVFKYFEKSGKLEDGMELLEVVRDVKAASLCVYGSLIRMCVAEKKSISEIVEMMKEDEIDIDDETMAIVEASQGGTCVNT
ncbi:hypothetical protein LXL04_031132 [Taraxacum kok-saghyz]